MRSILSRKSLTALVNGVANIGVVAVTQGELLNEKAFAANYGLNIEELYIDNLVIFVNSESKLADKETIDFSQMTNIKLSSTSFAPHFAGFFPAPDFRMLSIHSVYDIEECVKQSVLNYDVAAFLPKLCLVNDIHYKQGRIKPLKITGVETQLINFVAYADIGTLSPAEQKTLETIRAFYSELRDDSV